MINIPGSPSWLTEENIAKSLDARDMLANGEHPLARVLTETAELTKGQVYELITPFMPFPLIEKVKANGFIHFSANLSQSEVRSYFCKT